MGGHALTTARSWPAASLTGLLQCMPTHALTFTKHRQPMFNYYSIYTAVCKHRHIDNETTNVKELTKSHDQLPSINESMAITFIIDL